MNMYPLLAIRLFVTSWALRVSSPLTPVRHHRLRHTQVPAQFQRKGAAIVFRINLLQMKADHFCGVIPDLARVT